MAHAAQVEDIGLHFTGADLARCQPGGGGDTQGGGGVVNGGWVVGWTVELKLNRKNWIPS